MSDGISETWKKGVRDGEWHHVSKVKCSEEARVYLDGEEIKFCRCKSFKETTTCPNRFVCLTENRARNHEMQDVL